MKKCDSKKIFGAVAIAAGAALIGRVIYDFRKIRELTREDAEPDVVPVEPAEPAEPAEPETEAAPAAEEEAPAVETPAEEAPAESAEEAKAE